ncbi:hypothetical protein ACFFTM_03865 [Pseudoduganella plicata]|uniref:Uncharacterized protein n=1 Tax=Pseudoduganella plicata TaxID=321984 RepID=A0A4P7BG00_9BURK|nr:hypothetical protein [Pseudoduganella plicata]QBQ36917.1 hypothetical protein E1742_12630 [Pseudoduganella plicata]GGZ07600.1 hypothetical protein GCM10007388_46360 [Pseudoduganella plicata]
MTNPTQESGPQDWVALLHDKATRYDAVLMTITAQGQQQYLGTVERVYSRRFEGPEAYASGTLRFVGAPGTWGNQTLADGERALVFVRWLPHSGRYYQDHWHGHFTIVEVNGVACAVANWHLLRSTERTWGPEWLRNAAFLPDENKPWQVAIPFALLERHLIEELDRPGVR